VETSASFEARYAPLSYPTAGGDQRWPSLPRQVKPNRPDSCDLIRENATCNSNLSFRACGPLSAPASKKALSHGIATIEVCAL
jgi:hypothetical protein